MNKHFSISPSLILDVDNGIDFTFKGMGLSGNRSSSNDYVSYENTPDHLKSNWLANEYARQKRVGLKTGELFIFRVGPDGTDELIPMGRFEEKI